MYGIRSNIEISEKKVKRLTCQWVVTSWLEVIVCDVYDLY